MIPTVGTPRGTIQRFRAGDDVSAAHFNQLVDRANNIPPPTPMSAPKFVRTCRDASGNYPLPEDNPRRYPFRYITVELDASDPAGVAYNYLIPTPDGGTDKPDGTFVNLRPSEPTIALPYRAEDTFLWVWFGNGYYWSLEPELTAAIFRTPVGGIPAMVDDTPGSAVCVMQRINIDGILEPITTLSGETVTAKVFNLGASPAGDDVIIQAKRELGSGKWLGDWEGCPS